MIYKKIFPVVGSSWTLISGVGEERCSVQEEITVAGLESSLREGTELKEEEKAWRGRPGNLHWVTSWLICAFWIPPVSTHMTCKSATCSTFPWHLSYPIKHAWSWSWSRQKAEAQSGNRKQTVWGDRES